MLKTLLISSDQELVDRVEPTLRKLEFDVDRKPTVSDGMDKMRYERYCALVVDTSAGAIDEVRGSRDSWLKRDSTVIAIAPPTTSTLAEFPGADVVWSQPLVHWEVYRVLLNVRARATGDRRLRKRFSLPHATVLRFSYDGQRFSESTLIDITESGVAVEGVDELASGRPLRIEFKLPGMLGGIQTFAEVVWRSGRRAGLRFLQMPEQQQKRLERWLNNSRLGMSTGYSYASGY